jgi:hypothetical protein
VDAARLADLIAITADPTADLFRDHTETVVLPTLAARRPTFVGISILNRQQVIPGLFLARQVKEAGHTVVLGGTVYAKFHEALRHRPSFFTTFCHALVPYEGETALLAGRGPRRRSLGPRPGWCPTLSLDIDGHVPAPPSSGCDLPPRLRRSRSRPLPQPGAGAAHRHRQGLLLQPVQVL